MTNSTNKDISSDQFIEIIRYPKEILERTSQRLINDLYKEGFQNNNLHTQEVIDQIIHLETGNLSKTKDEAPFRGSQLQGLWHKHYRTNGMETLARNMHLAIKTDKEFNKKIESIAIENKNDLYKISSDYANLCKEELLRRYKESKGTGEWIIYTKYKGKNYYLCLSKHDDGDEVIRDKVVSNCCDQFPFIREILNV